MTTQSARFIDLWPVEPSVREPVEAFNGQSPPPPPAVMFCFVGYYLVLSWFEWKFLLIGLNSNAGVQLRPVIMQKAIIKQEFKYTTTLVVGTTAALDRQSEGLNSDEKETIRGFLQVFLFF